MNEFFSIVKQLDELFSLLENKIHLDENKFLKWDNEKYTFQYPNKDIEELFDKLTELADTLLITPSGNPNYSNFQILMDRYGGGLSFRPGEKDSFGWLSGIMETNHFCFTFG